MAKFTVGFPNLIETACCLLIKFSKSFPQKCSVNYYFPVAIDHTVLGPSEDIGAIVSPSFPSSIFSERAYRLGGPMHHTRPGKCQHTNIFPCDRLRERQVNTDIDITEAK